MRTLTALLISVDGRPTMTAKEFAALRCKSVRTVQNEIMANRCPVPFWKDGESHICNVADVARWMDKLRAQAINGSPHLEEFREAA